jgi:phosphatidylcholine synthase
VIAAWLVHAYTASGAALAFLALRSFVEHDYRTAFFWLWVQVIVDATDGGLARAARVKERIPWFDGGRLDDIVDYLTYAFVPAFFVWRGLLVPEPWTTPTAVAMLLSSAYGFSRSHAKTADHFFTGFPSYWNVVTLYMLLARWSPGANLVVLLVLAVLVFVPVRYVYPSRTPVWWWVTNLLGYGWSAMLVLMLWQYPNVSQPLLWLSYVYPVYYVLLSLTLHLGARSRGPKSPMERPDLASKS